MRQRGELTTKRVVCESESAADELQQTMMMEMRARTPWEIYPKHSELRPSAQLTAARADSELSAGALPPMLVRAACACWSMSCMWAYQLAFFAEQGAAC